MGHKAAGKTSKKHSTKTPVGTKRPRKESSPVVAEDVVCSVCHEGHSQKHNRIVLCDSCDTPFHQQCHTPRIDDYVTEVRDANWYCSECDEAQHSGKKRKLQTTELPTGASGEDLTEEQKKKYFSSLAPNVLVDLLLFAERLHPDLPIYPKGIKERLAISAVPKVIPNVVIDSNDQLRAVETKIKVSSPHSESLTVSTRKSLSPPPSAKNLASHTWNSEANSMISQCVLASQGQTFPIQTRIRTYDQNSPLQAHLPPATTLVQAPKTSTFTFSLSTSTTPNPNPVSQVSLPQDIVPASLPSYEEMVVQALIILNAQQGSPAKTIYDKIQSIYSLESKVRSSASQALHKATKRGRILKVGNLYKLNPNYTAPTKGRPHRQNSTSEPHSLSATASTLTPTDYNILQDFPDITFTHEFPTVDQSASLQITGVSDSLDSSTHKAPLSPTTTHPPKTIHTSQNLLSSQSITDSIFHSFSENIFEDTLIGKRPSH